MDNSAQPGIHIRAPSWWGDLLFARPIMFESPLSPDEVAERIQHLSRASPAFFNSMSYSVKEFQQSDNTYRFDIRTQWRGTGVDYTASRIVGRFEAAGENGRTIIRGEARFGLVYYLGILGYVLTVVMVVLTDPDREGCFWLWLMGAGIILLYIWRQIVVARNDLVQLLRQTII